MNNDEFLGEGYKVPQGDYFKFKQGANTFRAVSSAITGFEYWNNVGKPVRSREEWDYMPEDIRRDAKGNAEAVKHFWAFVVWNYEAEKVQILEITQKSIQNALKSYIANKKWGSPKGYDITVTRDGSGFDTEYITAAEPHSELPEKAQEAVKNRYVRLEALFDGSDPFTPENQA